VKETDVEVQSNAPDAKTSGVRTLRQVMDIALPLAGTGIILGVALFRQELQGTAFIVLGVFLVEVGIWKLAHKLLPEQRKYHALRAQADQFLTLVRQLNTAALRVKENNTPENFQAVEEIRQKMQHMVDRMAAVAGKTDAELAAAARLERKKEVAGAVA
jgi:hypothetical protein